MQLLNTVRWGFGNCDVSGKSQSNKTKETIYCQKHLFSDCPQFLPLNMVFLMI